MYFKSCRSLFFAMAAHISVLDALPAQAQSPVSRAKLDQMFANIAKDTTWNMSRDMLWGYFFTHPTRQPLEALLPPRKLVINTGSSRTELAKMIGTTPLWLTFNGM